MCCCARNEPEERVSTLFTVEGGHPDRLCTWEQFAIMFHGKEGDEYHIQAEYAGGGLFTGDIEGDKSTKASIIYNPETKTGSIELNQ